MFDLKSLALCRTPKRDESILLNVHLPYEPACPIVDWLVSLSVGQSVGHSVVISYIGHGRYTSMLLSVYFVV